MKFLNHFIILLFFMSSCGQREDETDSMSEKDFRPSDLAGLIVGLWTEQESGDTLSFNDDRFLDTRNRIGSNKYTFGIVLSKENDDIYLMIVESKPDTLFNQSQEYDTIAFRKEKETFFRIESLQQNIIVFDHLLEYGNDVKLERIENVR